MRVLHPGRRLLLPCDVSQLRTPASVRPQSHVAPSRPPQKTRKGQPVEAAKLPVALACGKDQAEISRMARNLKAARQCLEQRVGRSDTDKSGSSNRIARADQRDRRIHIGEFTGRWHEL